MTPEAKPPDLNTEVNLLGRVADLRYCGVCWQGRTDGVRLHYCDLPLGHGKEGKDHRCHCGKVLKVPAKLEGAK